jgi:hypothetical protein
LTVTFTNLSPAQFTNFTWDFGDGITSTEKSPGHTYTMAGSFPVTLTAMGPITDTVHAYQGPYVLTLFYLQDPADRAMGLLFHVSRATKTWSQVPISGRSTTLNWLASEPVREDGIYAIGRRP